ncbi:MAG: hypothetical protein QGI83_24805 [Candidatus Latescibacteria bacterium]|nr:hypothetical protein [Candidatus Latescibacterota bacterium]
MATTISSLGQPCRAKNILSGRIIRNRHGDGELLVLASSNEVAGVQLLFVDFEKDTAEAFTSPAGSGAWGLVEVPDDRLVISTHYDGKYVVFDLKTMAFTQVVDFPDEAYIWATVIGSDGRVYGGTYPSAKIAAFDPTTCEVEEVAASPVYNMYGRVSVTIDGRILCSFGQNTETSLLFDPGTSELGPVPDDARSGAVWQGCSIVGSTVYRGTTSEEIDPPFPVPSADGGEWSADPVLSTEEALFLRQGDAVYRYRSGDAELTLMCDYPSRGIRLFGSSADGNLLGIRGQDYVVIEPGSKEPTLRPIPVQTGPRPTLPFKIDAQDWIWGGPIFGQTLFCLDTQSGEFENTNTVCDAGGEVYDVTFLDGKVYTASYSGGDIACYDPSRPWDQWNHLNPRPLAKLGPDYIRPIAGIWVGSGDKLYSGWMAKYGTYGGAVAITDPGTGETRRIENPLGEQAVAGLGVGERDLFVGTSLGANGLGEKEGESPSFGVIDIETGEATFRHTFEGASSVSPVRYDAETGLVVMGVKGRALVFDPDNPGTPVELSEDVPDLRGEVAAPGDGHLYYGNGKALYALDLKEGKAEKIAELAADITHVAVGTDGSIYVACYTEVFGVGR